MFGELRLDAVARCLVLTNKQPPLIRVSYAGGSTPPQRLNAAEAARKLKFEGRVTLEGSRTPLSKILLFSGKIFKKSLENAIVLGELARFLEKSDTPLVGVN